MASIEQTLRVTDHHPHINEIAAAHRFLAEMPSAVVQMFVYGRVARTSDRPAWLRRACNFNYLGTSDDGVILFRAPALGEVAPKVFTGQRDLFDDTVDPHLTAFSLLGRGLQEVISDNDNSDLADADFLRKLGRLTKYVFHGASRLVLDGLQGQDLLSLDTTVTTRAQALLDRTPPPQRVCVAGVVTSLRRRGNAFELKALDGHTVRCILGDGDVRDLVAYFSSGATVAVTGQAVFRPSRTVLRIETDAANVVPARLEDKIFGRLPVARSATSPASRPQADAQGSWVGRIVGRWPGDETDDEIRAALDS